MELFIILKRETLPFDDKYNYIEVTLEKVSIWDCVNNEVFV
jgi:hypothetical protein